MKRPLLDITAFIIILQIAVQPGYAAGSGKQPCQPYRFEQHSYTLCTAPLSRFDIQIFWQRPDGAPYAYLNALHNGILYVGAQSELYALNAGNGATLWHREFNGGLISTIGTQAVYGMTKGINSRQQGYLRLFALNAQTGRELWHYDMTFSGSSPLVG